MDKQKYRDIIHNFLALRGQTRTAHLDYARSVLTASQDGRAVFVAYGQALKRQPLVRYMPELADLMRIYEEGFDQAFIDELLAELPEIPADLAA